LIPAGFVLTRPVSGFTNTGRCLLPFALPDDAQEQYDTTDRTIAESNNFIVLDKCHGMGAGDRYQSESELERELIQDLRNQGYEFVPDLTSQRRCWPMSGAASNLNQVVFSKVNGGALLRVISITPVILLSIKPVRFMITTFVISLLMMVVWKTSI
jgi:hypothetical protein